MGASHGWRISGEHRPTRVFKITYQTVLLEFEMEDLTKLGTFWHNEPMTQAATRYDHITLNDHGTPVIAQTGFKVVMLVAAQRAHGYSPEELHFQYPQLSMAQIHSALAYYWDHQPEMDAEIERRATDAEKIQARTLGRGVR